MENPQALFDIDGDHLVPGPLTRGGWSDDAQHGSPPAGALARAVELVGTPVPMQVVRLTVDLFRQVPLSPLEGTTRGLREGKRMQVVEATLRANGLVLGQAVALKIRTAELDGGDELVGTGPPDEPPYPGPEDLDALDWRGRFGEERGLTRFHNDAIEIRTIDESFLRVAEGRSWFRLHVPLVRGEEVTPFQRMAVMADLANGNSQALDPQRWLFVNPDITLYVERLPVGDWIGMKSVVRQVPSGLGVTASVMYDRTGRVGQVNQAQVIERQ